MKWFLLVFVMEPHQGNQQGLLWHDPIFDSGQECIEWTNNNVPEVINALNYYIPDWEIDRMVCADEEHLESLDIRPYVDAKSI